MRPGTEKNLEKGKVTFFRSRASDTQQRVIAGIHDTFGQELIFLSDRSLYESSRRKWFVMTAFW
jgi:hypothetical protein